MGTNYYLHVKGNLLERLDDTPEEVLHIGKSSGGWCFLMHVIPERGINSLTDWYRMFRRDNNRIVDEYGVELGIDEMLHIIMNRKWRERDDLWTTRICQEYGSVSVFLTRNHAEFGPNNLLRSRIGNGTVAHGPGTWDLIRSEFS